MKVGDWIRNRKHTKDVFQITSIELTIDETILHEAKTPIQRMLAVRPFLQLARRRGAGGFTERPEDFEVVEE